MPLIKNILAALSLAAIAFVSPAFATDSTVTLSFSEGQFTDLDARQFHVYEKTYDETTAELVSLKLRQRKADPDAMQLSIVRVDGATLWGLPAYWGLAKMTDPTTGVSSGGWALGLLHPDEGRSKVTVAIISPATADLLDIAVVYAGERDPLPVDPPVNTYFADSIGPIGHLNSAQSDSTGVPGPLGYNDTLDSTDLTYNFLGPARFGIAISPKYPGGGRVIWSNGGDRISKVEYGSLQVLAELPISETLMSEAESETRIWTLDSLTGDDLAFAAFPYAAQELAGLAGVYYALDKDNTLFVGGAESIIAYGDAFPGQKDSPIIVKDEWFKPAEIGGNFVGVNMTFDGRLCLVTDEGWVVIAERDFSEIWTTELAGSEIAAQWNQDKIDEGFRPGAASWVRNSAAIGQDGGIYVPSLEHMHKVIWDSTTQTLSTDPADGAWVAPFQNGRGIGTGATPSLMGFGDEDKFVVITDGDDLMNVVLYWRDEIPAGWTQLPGTLDRRIAGQLPADFDDPGITAVQSEQSVIIGGYGAAVVNNEPPNPNPVGLPPAATTLLAGYAGNDEKWAPMGIQKMEWNPDTQTFEDAWVQPNVSSANSVPLVSTSANMMYTVGGRDGDWSLEAVDWSDGSSVFYWITGSQRYNTRYSGLFLDEEGHIVHTTTYGIVRYER